MKNLLFGLMATVVFASISYGQEFKGLYENFKKSSEPVYIKLEEFDKKLKVDIDDAIFNSEETFKEWLQKNISKTEYKTLEEALKDYNEQINLTAQILKENSDFINQIKDNEKEFLNLLSELPLNGIPIASTYKGPGNSTQNFPCVSECINNAVQCSNNADAAYSESMMISGATFATGNAFGAAVIAYGAYRLHSRAIKACVRTLNACTGQC